MITLLLIAASHAALGLCEGFADGGDFSLLWIDAFFSVPTLAVAGLFLSRNQVALGAAFAGSVLLLTLSVMAVGLYLLGLFHLPRAAAAVVVTRRRVLRG